MAKLRAHGTVLTLADARSPRYTEARQRALVRSQAARSAAVVKAQLRSTQERTPEDRQRIVVDMLTFPPAWDPPELKWSGLIVQQALMTGSRLALPAATGPFQLNGTTEPC